MCMGKARYHYNQLVDGVHPSMELKGRWSEVASTAIRQNEEDVQTRLTLHETNTEESDVGRDSILTADDCSAESDGGGGQFRSAF